MKPLLIKLEVQRNVWDEEQKKRVSIVSISDEDRYVAFDATALRGKYAALEAVGVALRALERQDDAEL